MLQAQRISKRFGNTVALDDVSLSFAAGEVHALVGENGAGKSTLGKIIAGLLCPDRGEVIVEGRRLERGSLRDAFAAGVRIVHQELAQCPNLSVAENLCLHDLPRHRLGLVDREAMERRASVLLSRLDDGIDVTAPLGSLAPGRRQIVQIAGALDERGGRADTAARSRGPARAARLIVFDEPTSSLSVAESERLAAIIRQLAGEGLGIVYVSHRMAEVFSCCDRVTVLRDGRLVKSAPIDAMDEDRLVELMIGRPAPQARAARPKQADSERGQGGPARLEVRGLGTRRASKDLLRDISLSVAPGEILGLGGLVGAGRSELLDALFGLGENTTGEILVEGSAVRISTPRRAIRAGFGYVPEDRRLQGLFFALGVHENVALPAMPRLARCGWRRMEAEQHLVAERVARFQIKCASTTSSPGQLSGGNQQKLLIARWMGRATRILLLDEPTRGIDVGTKAEIHRLIREAAGRGTAVLLVSSEMPELLALSDRIVVLCEGRMTGELRGSEMTQSAVLRLATRPQDKQL